MSDEIEQERMPRWVRQAIFLWWGGLVVLWLGLTVTRELRGLLTQLAIALFLSFAMEPFVERLGRRGLSRSAATALTMLTVAFFLVVFIAAMGSLVAGQVRQLATDLPDYLSGAERWVEGRFDVDIDSDNVLQQLEEGGQASEYLTAVADNVVGVGAAVAGILFQILTVSLFAFYLTADGPRLRKAICSVLSPARQHEVLRVWELAIAKTGGFLSSRFILAAISALFHGIVFAALNLPSSIALALWVGLISQFIPVIGTYIAGVVPALIALGIQPTRALWVVAAIVLYQQLENYLIQPRVTARTLNMHPGVAFAAVLAGTATFGATGAVLALPFLATVQSFIAAYIERHEVVDSKLVTGPIAPVAATDGRDGDGDGDGDITVEAVPDDEAEPT